jgi:hypothetical protein
MRKIIAVLFVAALLAGAVNADSVIGVNFNYGSERVGTGTADGFGNWTDTTTGANGTGLVLLGSNSGVTVNWTSKNTWYAGTTANAEETMWYGYLDDGSSGSIVGADVTISGLSAWLSAVGATGYTVRVYLNTDNPASTIGDTLIYDGTTTVLDTLVSTPENTWVNGTFGKHAKIDSDVLSNGTIRIEGFPSAYQGTVRGCISAVKITAFNARIANNSPANGAVNIPFALTSPENDLKFTINDPNIQKVDVQLGLESDPNLTSKPVYKIVTNLPTTASVPAQYTVNLETLVTDLIPEKTYYWKVIGYEPNGVNFNPVPGPVWSFTTKPMDAAPVVDAGDSVITTLALTSSPNVLALNGSVIDDGVSALTVTWKAYEVAYGGGLTTKVTFADQTNPSTTVTISESGTYILNLSATDATGTVSDTMEIVVYDSDCDAAKATGTHVANYYDRDDNCVVDLSDFAVFALEWLDSTALTESYLHAATVTAGTDNALFAEYWTGVSGTDPNSLLEDSRYPASPNGSYLVVNQLSGSMTGDNYGQRIRGYIVPQTTGTYTFYIASDDGSRLFLGADTNPVNTDPALGNQIAEVPGGNWTNANEWTKFPEQKSAPVALTAGQYYYVEVLHKEGDGGDNVSVGWSTDGGTTIVVISGAVLRYAMP